MKTILASTDFSRQSNNAVKYAAELAVITKARLILLHVYTIPVITGDVPVVMPVWPEVEKDSINALNKKKNALIRKYGKKLQVVCVSKLGYDISETIQKCIAENNADLAVMGIHGAGYLSEKLIGSTTTTLIKKSNCPVMVINEKVKFRRFKKIALAYDYKEALGKEVVSSLNDFVKMFKSELLVVNVLNKDQALPSEKNAVAGIRTEHKLEKIRHSYYFVQGEDTIKGLNRLVTLKKADMMVIIPRKHNFLDKIIHESNTKKMAFHTKLPLLVLHES